MSSSPLLSIIIPVYKVEKYLPACLDSIIAQEFTDWEVIAVDDGSPDGSGAILDRYAAQDSRIIDLHRENGGVSAARNAGIDHARGKYLGFVDSDDLIAPDMYQQLIAEMENENCDLAECGFCNFFEDGRREDVLTCSAPTKFVSREETIIAQADARILGSICNKVFLRELAANLCLRTDLAVAEDVLFVHDYLNHAQNAKILPFVGYHYRQHGASVMHESLSEKHLGVLQVYDLLFDRYKDHPAILSRMSLRDTMTTMGIMIKIIQRKEMKNMLSPLRRRILSNIPLLPKDGSVGRKLKLQLFLLKYFPPLYSLFYLLRKPK